MLRWTPDQEQIDYCISIDEHLPYFPWNKVKAHDLHTFVALSKGFILICSTVAQLLHRKQPPTVQNIKDFISATYFWNLDLKISKQTDTLNSFYQAGGKIEYVLDALLHISEQAWDASDEDGLHEKIKTLPASSLDGVFDVVWYMCIDGGGGSWDPDLPRGPHNYSS